MLSKEDNELVTRVGPGTPMGILMREYWVPALLASELPSPDSDPVRVMLLGEKLIAFRDSNGNAGLIQNHCPHRGASLFFGRNEEAGLRCVYHGWKFSVDGTCVDMPNEPAESDFKHKVRAVAYPCKERGGVIWAYMGPRTEPPALPDLEPNMLPDDQVVLAAIQRECNWLQGLEGDIDTSHLGFLHLGAVQPGDTRADTFAYYTVNDRAPHYQVVDTEYGAMYGAYRPGPDGQQYWRFAQFLFPFYAMIPTGVLGLQVLVRAWVPMDDEHMMFFSMGSRASQVQSSNVNANRRMVRQRPGEMLLPNTTDWYGRFRLEANAANDYRIDRDKQRRKEDYTGIPGIHTQDQAVTESMGPIYDRTSERLGTSDVMVIRVRRRLIEAARAFADRGLTPPGVDSPEVYRVRSGGAFLPKDANWIEATTELRKAFVSHPELDPALAG
ncbi:MAG: Rieske 2Fe-2S domain-containing protein [Chloroflexi bacterium]|nr:Rieske 2Fe-2S domain-containing protein [Chloroflexota bacterium]MBV9596929.1 Rieske 2Fe-2S domain-containing protein [Chloroflexota bacterium]